MACVKIKHKVFTIAAPNYPFLMPLKVGKYVHATYQIPLEHATTNLKKITNPQEDKKNT